MNLSQLLSQEQNLLHIQAELKGKINSASLTQQDKNLLTAELAATNRALQSVRTQLP